MVYTHSIHLPNPFLPGMGVQVAFNFSPSPQIIVLWAYMSPLQYIAGTGITGSEGMCKLNLMKSCLIAFQNASPSPPPLEVHESESIT